MSTQFKKSVSRKRGDFPLGWNYTVRAQLGHRVKSKYTVGTQGSVHRRTQCSVQVTVTPFPNISINKVQSMDELGDQYKVVFRGLPAEISWEIHSVGRGMVKGKFN